MNKLKTKWLFNVRGDSLAGITLTLALIPDAIAFSFIAGVNPMIGLFTTVIIMIVISFFGARPAMISSSAGSMSVLMAPLVIAHGIQYLFAATILAGLIQIVLGLLKTGRWMNFVPHAVISGFINALAVLIFIDQWKELKQGSFLMYGIVAATLALIYVVPRFIKIIPSPLISVALITIVVFLFHMPLETLGEQVSIVNKLPIPGLPDIAYSFKSLWIIFPFAMSLALVGYTETLLTQTMIDDLTQERTNKNIELRGQGIANAIAGFFGGMAGCALVAESTIHVKLGARGRLSTLVGGSFLLLMVVLFGNVVRVIPIAALVGVMLMICYEIFDWSSILRRKDTPSSETVVMVITAVTGIVTHNLAIGTLAGVVVSILIYVYKTSKIKVSSEVIDGEQIYRISGPVFFASAKELHDRIDLNSNYNKVIINLDNAVVWDHSARLTLKDISKKFAEIGVSVKVIGLN